MKLLKTGLLDGNHPPFWAKRCELRRLRHRPEGMPSVEVNLGYF